MLRECDTYDATIRPDPQEAVEHGRWAPRTPDELAAERPIRTTATVSDRTNMPLVRCPACATTTADPDPEYTCPSCRRRLRWRTDVPLGPVQLGLFGEVVPAEYPTPRRRRSPEAPSQELERAPRTQPPWQSHADVLAAATELFHDQDGFTVEGIDRARAMLADQSAGDLEEAALGGAWMLAMTLRALEKLDPGLGGEMLRLLGLTLADRDIH